MERAFCPPTLIPRSSATQLGMACNLCIRPTFAQGYPRERTRWLEKSGIPVLKLPDAVPENALDAVIFRIAARQTLLPEKPKLATLSACL